MMKEKKETQTEAPNLEPQPQKPGGGKGKEPDESLCIKTKKVKTDCPRLQTHAEE